MPIAVILNPLSGSAKTNPRIGTELAELFRSAGLHAEIVALRPGQDPADAARDVSRDASVIVAGGGDGTVNGVASGLLDRPESRAALAVLPLGTLNHFAKDLGIPIDVPKAVAVIAAGHTARVDVGDVNGHRFVNNSSIGIYPRIVEEQEDVRRQGYRKWPAMAIAAWRVLRQDRGVSVVLEEHGQRRTRRTPFVFVGNNEYAVDGLALGGRARLDGGRLFVYLTPHVPARDLPALAIRALLGRARQSGAFEISSTTELTIETRGARHIEVSCDGEVATMVTPLRYRIRPGALQVLVPAAGGGT